ncbi:hypothetical protein GGI12_005281 [Dipsacomyces acuminosporus]|nr:hypothetical protein GGI12_005281 [Dipsacomyces acuminosporus]
MFHLSRESLDSMLASAREFMPKGKRLSDNDLICALVAKTFAQSETETAAEKILSFIASRVFRKAGKEILVGLCCDTRYRLGIADKNFMGSCTILPFWKFSCAELKVPTAPESLAAIAKRVRNVVDTIDAEYMGSFMDVIDSNPSFHAQIFSCAVKYSTFTLTNHTRFNLYGTDFGDGVQQWSSYIPGLKYNVAMIQPCPPGTDGVNIFLEADTRAMQGILRNAFWMSIAEVIY